MVLENQRDCRGVAAVTGYRSTSSGAVDLRLFEAERPSLSRPIEGQPGDLHELGRGETEGLASVENDFGDLGAQKGQPDQPGDIGVVHAFGFGDIAGSCGGCPEARVSRGRGG